MSAESFRVLCLILLGGIFCMLTVIAYFVADIRDRVMGER